MSAAKKDIISLLEANALADIARIAVKDRKVLSHLVRLAYNKETLLGWRAILSVGLAARELVASDREFLRETCRKLLWSLSDESGGIGWSAPEMLGEIVSADPGRFADLVPLIAGVFDVEEDSFRAGAIYALRRIAEQSPAAVLSQHAQILAALADGDPRTRIFGIQVIGLIWQHACREDQWPEHRCEEARKGIQKLLGDRSEAWIYENAAFQSILVGETAGNILKSLY